MTPLKPISSRLVRGVSGPSYPLNEICSVPGCRAWTADPHHLFPRSQLAGAYDWVEIGRGSGGHIYIQPNVTGLCRKHHDDVEQHRAWIKLENGVYVWYYRHFFRGSSPDPGVEREKWEPLGALSPQPGPHRAAPERASVAPQPGGSAMLLADGTTRKEKGTGETVVGVGISAVSEEHDHADDEECPTCHGSGRRKRKPKTEQKPKKTFGIAIPNSEQPDGYQGLRDLVDESTKMLKQAELLKLKTDATYHVLHYALTFFVMNFNPSKVEIG